MNKSQQKVLFIAGQIACLLIALWAAYHKEWIEVAKFLAMAGFLRITPPKDVAIALIAVTCFSACKGNFSHNWDFRNQAASAPVDGIRLTPYASTQIPSGEIGIWAESTSGVPVLQAADGTQWRAGESSSIKLGSCLVSAGSFGKVCADQISGQYYHYQNGWKKFPQQDELLLHKASAETITGRKTFPGGLNAPIIPSIVSGAGVQVTGHVVPNIADDTFALLLASQELRNKTINATYNTITGIPLSTRNLIAGAGLTGGGDLSADRTFNVVANGDGSIVVNANDIQVGVISDTQHGSRAGGTLHANAIASGAAGFMSGADKAKLDGLGDTSWMIFGGQTNTDAFGASTIYLGAIGTASFLGTQIALGIASKTGTATYLTVSIRTAPGGSDTVIWTVQKSSDMGATWSDTTLTCTMTGSTKTCQGVQTPAITLYDWLALKGVSSAGVAAGPVTAGIRIN